MTITAINNGFRVSRIWKWKGNIVYCVAVVWMWCVCMGVCICKGLNRNIIYNRPLTLHILPSTEPTISFSRMILGINVSLTRYVSWPALLLWLWCCFRRGFTVVYTYGVRVVVAGLGGSLSSKCIWGQRTYSLEFS